MQRWLREVTMGLVRKTLSVATLGAVSFRSKKEKLRRAERALRDAEGDLARERSTRETAERRIGAAEERVKHATAQASHAATRLEKVKRKQKAKATNEFDAGAVFDVKPAENIELDVESSRYKARQGQGGDRRS